MRRPRWSRPYQDLAAARAAGLEPALLDRLTLSDKAVDGMIEGLRAGGGPAGPDRRDAGHARTCPSGIQVGKMRVPLGVIGIIYEVAAQRDHRRRQPCA